MLNFSLLRLVAAMSFCIIVVDSEAASFRVQCPGSTITHPNAAANNSEPAYNGPTKLVCTVQNGCGGSAGNVGYLVPSGNVNGAIKCQQISGGDGFATMADGTQTYLFAFGPLSGLADIAKGLPGTEFPGVFNQIYDVNHQLQTAYPGLSATYFNAAAPLAPGEPATTNGASDSPGYSVGTLGQFGFNGAVGQVPDIANIVTIFSMNETGNTVTVTTNTALGLSVGDKVVISGIAPAGYDGTFTVTALGDTIFTAANPNTTGFPNSNSFQYQATVSGLPALNPVTGTALTGTAGTPPTIDGFVDPRQIMDVAVMNGNLPAPMIAVDEDDEFFLTLTNVGMIMRPDLFEQHTVHWHGYPNASAFYDGVPDASVAINIGGSMTYYYLAPDAGTYFFHCHITPPEHLQMGMVGQIYVRPRQDRVAIGTSLYTALQQQDGLAPGQTSVDLRTKCDSSADILCSNPLPPADSGVKQTVDPLTGKPQLYAYNDGDGSTAYDVEYPIQIHGFDPNFHFVGMTFNPEGFADMKDKYFLLNGRSYPDTVSPGPIATQTTDGVMHYSQPLPSIINIPVGGRALLRISDLDVQEMQTIASLGIPMKVIALNAKLLRDQAGNNMYYDTNSVTLGGGESLDVILDASDKTKYAAGQVYYLYTPNLDHLSNDAENFGGLMTEVHICNSVTGGTFGNTCK